ncbi:MAG: tetratricopeptide repeat protein [Trueperaceae bacterium]|nr:tetratricopeptide repeat protein [Trueperaceae bacterium]
MQQSIYIQRYFHKKYLILILLPLILLTLVLNSPGFIVPKLDAYSYPYQTSSAQVTQRKLEQDIAFYQNRVNLNPTDGLELAALASTYLKKARSSGWANWYLLAQQAAERSLLNLPVFNHGAVLVLAEIAAAQHNFTEAVNMANDILEYQPGNEAATSLLVTSLLAQGKLIEAQTLADSLATKVPSSGTLSLQALLETDQGQDDIAETHFRSAIGLEEPGDAYASAWLRVQYGKFKARYGKYTEATALYQEALRIIPDFPLALLSYADLNLKEGHFSKANNQFQKVLDHSENSSTIFDHAALQGLAQLAILRAKDANPNWQRAETILRKDVFSNAYGHRRELARLLLSRGEGQDNKEALELLESEMGNRQDEQTLELYAWALYKTGNLAKAAEVIQTTLSTGFNEAGLYYRAGLIEQALGDSETAQAYINQVKTLNPDFNAALWEKLELRN